MGNNERAVMNVAYEADNLGYTPVVLGYIIEGEASDVAGVYTSLAEQLINLSNIGVSKTICPRHIVLERYRPR